MKVLCRVFRGRFVAALRRAFAEGQLEFHGKLRILSHPKAFSSFLRQLFRQDWVVYCKRPFVGPEHLLDYLGRYTHRVAISNHRLVSFADDQITFRWRDYANDNQQRLLTLPAEEFFRRFLLHLLPSGFVRIRHFGFLANRRRAAFLSCYFQLLAPPTQSSAAVSELLLNSICSLWTCSWCVRTDDPHRVLDCGSDAAVLSSPPCLPSRMNAKPTPPSNTIY